MFSVYIWLYTFFLVIAWWFFIVTKIHVYKFKNFSNYITKVIPFLWTMLIILSILGYIIIFIYNPGTSTYKVNTKNNTNVVEY